MRAPLPRRRWRVVVAATQGVVLTIAAAGILPRALTQALLAVALALLAASMGECVWWLWRRARSPGLSAARGASPWRSRRSALLLVWAALVAPNHPGRLTLGEFVRLPLELLVVVAVAALLPAAPRRVLAVAAGAVLSVLVLVKVLDIGFFTAFDRPFKPVDDSSYLGIGIETLRDAIGGERGPRRRRRGRARRRAARRPGPGAAARDAGRGRPPRLGAPCDGGARRGLGGPARRRRAGRLLERGRPGRRRGAGGAGGPAGSRGARPPDRPGPLPRHPRPPAAHRAAGQGRPARVRRELRDGRARGHVPPGSTPCSTRAPRSCAPPASPRAARSSPRPPSAASAGWRTPPCRRGSGSTASGATTSSSRRSASRSRGRSSAPAGEPSASCPRTTGRGRRAAASTATTRSTTAATSATAARTSACRRCPTSTPSSPSSGASSPRVTGRRCSPRST